jgi:hypothetical protein
MKKKGKKKYSNMTECRGEKSDVARRKTELNILSILRLMFIETC